MDEADTRRPGLEPRIIQGSRGKTIAYLLGSLALGVGGALMVRDPKVDARFWGWAAMCFFGLGVLAFSWLLVRPQTLRLDPEGFTLAGGFISRPRRIPWRDVKGFFVYRLPRGGTMVGFNFATGTAAAGRLGRFNRRFGVEGALPKGWPMAVLDLVDLLNDYRDRALRE